MLKCNALRKKGPDFISLRIIAAYIKQIYGLMKKIIVAGVEYSRITEGSENTGVLSS